MTWKGWWWEVEGLMESLRLPLLIMNAKRFCFSTRIPRIFEENTKKRTFCSVIFGIAGLISEYTDELWNMILYQPFPLGILSMDSKFYFSQLLSVYYNWYRNNHKDLPRFGHDKKHLSISPLWEDKVGHLPTHLIFE